uniref:Uncharacterized protein n=1 Tax=Oryza sativa subsp. japonica TaxID=39947 RepID=Q75GW1_ORYSJ|nr:hypothetical protein [Oryza sativa Japonica Group]
MVGMELVRSPVEEALEEMWLRGRGRGGGVCRGTGRRWGRGMHGGSCVLYLRSGAHPAVPEMAAEERFVAGDLAGRDGCCCGSGRGGDGGEANPVGEGHKWQQQKATGHGW